MWKRLHDKYQLFLSNFNDTWSFSPDFRGGGGTQVSNSIKIRPEEAEVFHADGQKDRGCDKAFRNFANAP
jgi:hypothetical protein